MKFEPIIRGLCVAAGFGLVVISAGVPAFGAPTAATQKASVRGAKVYGQYCSQCHGPNMVNPGNASFDLRAFPADQHDRFISSVTNGKRAMPAWDGIITPAQTEELWAYVSAAKAKRPVTKKK